MGNAQIAVIVPREIDAWATGFGRLAATVPARGKTNLDDALDAFFDASQDVVHVITGELKESGRLIGTTLDGDTISGAVVYDAEHAPYEHARGGEHAFLDRAWEETSHVFEDAIADIWGEVVRTWR